MAPTQIKCAFAGCTHVSESESEQIALAQFQSHLAGHQMAAHQPPQARAPTKQKLPPIERPKIKQDVTEEEWNSFTQEWKRFKRCTEIPTGQEADQLFDCCEKGLGRLLLKEDPDIIDAGENSLLGAMQKMAVIKIATSVRRTKLLSLKQDHGQSFREFYANVKAQASTCNFTVKCGQACCANAPAVDYTSLVIKDILVSGIADTDIRKDVLEWSELDTKSDKDLVGFVEGKETSKKAWSGQVSDTAAVSTFRKAAKQEEPDFKKKTSLKSKCTKCGVQIFQFTRNRTGRINRTAYTICIKCHRETSTEAHAEDSSDGASKIKSESSAIHGFISAVDSSTPAPEDIRPTESNSVQSSYSKKHAKKIVLDHHIFTQDGWTRATSLSHPTLRLRMFICDDDYQSFGVTPASILPKHIDIVADSGAQSCLWSRKEFLKSGFNLTDLIDVHHTMEAANAAPIRIDGAILLRLSGDNDLGEKIEAAVMVYVSPDAKRFYLSREAMVQLGIIPRGFPQVGAAILNDSRCNAIDHSCEVEVPDCSCQKRQLPPGKPNQLPFEANVDNAGKMKAWLLKRYATSTFNKCPHRPLPAMKGPPIQFHIDPDATPITMRKPAPVPLHWQEQVEEELNRDVALGVLERVPHGEPTGWCFRMVVTRKHNGDPRRTVDLSPLNKFCQREAHASKSPFQLARSVPPSSHKTVLDAWNGYHSVPIREEDQHLTTFTTPWGLFRYKRAPQGYISSGDGFNRRLDDITAHILRMERCVDDSLLHDISLEEHWWRVIDFLELAGNTGIVINPEKFQFSQDTVDFAGFRISNDAVEPLPKYIDAIRGFPTPQNITDIRSWFGLVNQVAHYAQLREMLEPFRRFLSPKVPFEWNAELDSAFTKSRDCIIAAIREGVQIFDVTRRTCLRTDWSKNGIGYFLSQKHCLCKSESFGCCDDGWKITLAGSRFLSQTESNYAPIEGEALAVAWALEQTRFFTMGCNNLLVIVDHKPLTKIFGDRRLDEIDNPRLFRLKRRTLMWRFDMEYQPGKTNAFSDAVWRYPNEYTEIASASLVDDVNSEEESIIAGIFSELDKFFAVTWERVRSESKDDKDVTLLIRLINEGFPKTKSEMPKELIAYWEFRHNLTSIDGVVLYMDRIIVPYKLRSRILENLHSAHQGTAGMFSRAQTIVFWPGITVDIEMARTKCRTCHRNAPSQARLPPNEPRIPKVPFEMIYADYFKLQGSHFLIVGDRLSGWTEVFRTKPGSSSSGSKGLCEALRRVFTTFGIPDDLSSDGGPEFIALETDDLLKRWGINHSLSSAYFPQSNGRAEVAVRITKRLLEENIGPDGSINNDKIVRALLQLRNTPDRDCYLSPAEVLFGHRLKDAMPQLDKSAMVFESPQIHSQWRQAWSAKEEAVRSRMVKTCERLEQHSKELPPLREGDTVFLQNQDPAARKPKKWDREGTVIQTGEHDQYLVKVHGTGRITLRNRRFLRKFIQRSPCITHVPESQTTLTRPEQQYPDTQRGPVHSGHEAPATLCDRPSLLGAPAQSTRITRAPQEDQFMLPSTHLPSSLSIDEELPQILSDIPPVPIPTPLQPAAVEESSRWDPQPQQSPTTVGDHCRRSNRTPVARVVYDASTGGYVAPKQ